MGYIGELGGPDMGYNIGSEPMTTGTSPDTNPISTRRRKTPHPRMQFTPTPNEPSKTPAPHGGNQDQSIAKPAMTLKETSPLVGIRSFERTPEMYQTAHDFGIVYNSAVRSLFSDNPSTEIATIQSHLRKLPTWLQKMYIVGVKHVYEALLRNDRLLTEANSQEKLITQLGTFSEKSEEKQQEIKETIREGGPIFATPTPGLPVVILPPVTYQYLIAEGVLTKSDGVLYHGNGNFPTRIILQEDTLLNIQELELSENGTAKHEAHHFFWKGLEDSGFTRDVIQQKEKTHQYDRAFRWFKDELCAYIFINFPYHQVAPENLIYTKEYIPESNETLKQELWTFTAKRAKFAQFCRDVCLSKGIPKYDLLYPIMTAQNFSDLEKRMALFVPMEQTMSVADYNTFYDLWDKYNPAYNSTDFSEEFNKFLQMRNISNDQEALKRFIHGKLSQAKRQPSDRTYIYDVALETTKLLPFLQKGLSQTIAEEDVVIEYLRTHLPLPAKTIDLLLQNLNTEAVEDIPVTSDPRELMLSYIDFNRYNISSQELAFYKTFVNSSEGTRQLFQELKAEIEQRNIERLKKDYDSSSDRRKQLIDKRITFIQKQIASLVES